MDNFQYNSTQTNLERQFQVEIKESGKYDQVICHVAKHCSIPNLHNEIAVCVNRPLILWNTYLNFDFNLAISYAVEVLVIKE